MGDDVEALDIADAGTKTEGSTPTAQSGGNAADILKRQADVQAQALRQALGNVEDPSIARSLRQALDSLGALTPEEAAEFDISSNNDKLDKDKPPEIEDRKHDDPGFQQHSNEPIFNMRIDSTATEDSESRPAEGDDSADTDDAEEEKTFFS